MDEAVFFGLTATDLAGRGLMLAIAVGAAAVVSHLLAKLLRHVLDASNVPSASIFVNIMRALVWAFALLSVMEPVFGVQPDAFITALGVTSLAISLGMQDTVSNIVGGLSLMASKVVQPGDHIEVSGFQGEVTDVNWRSTIVRDRLGNTEVIPNSVLSKSSFKRLSEPSSTLVDLQLVVAHGTDFEAVEAEILEASNKALAEWLVEGQPSAVCFVSDDAYGISCAVYLHVAYGISGDGARNLVMRELGARPWLARAAAQ